jgi:acetoin utilization deacetylase AcuC-like enzyme
MTSFVQHPFYPYSGTGSAAPNMVNVPLAAGSGGAAARRAVTQDWLPALDAFQPQMLFISAGFDAHREDLLGGMALEDADYVWLTQELMAVAERHAGRRIVSMLEGGYNLAALGRSAAAHVKTLAS